jgi:hypothetical protein
VIAAPLRRRRDGFVLSDHALRESLRHLQDFLAFAFEHACDRNSGPSRDYIGDVFFGDLLFEQRTFILHGCKPLVQFSLPLLELDEFAILEFGGALVIPVTLGLFRLRSA